MSRIGWHLVACLVSKPRGLRCRAGRHAWTILTDPPSCARCTVRGSWE